MKKKILQIIIFSVFGYQSLAQVITTTTQTSKEVTQTGITFGKDIWLEEGKSYDFKHTKDKLFSTTIKVLELDPMNNLPRFYTSLQAGFMTTEVLGINNQGASTSNIEVLGKLKYFTNNNKIRYDFSAAYGFSGKSDQSSIANDISRIRGNIGVQYVPFRFLTNRIPSQPTLNFSAAQAIDPMTKMPYPIEIIARYKIVREVGFRTGALYNATMYNIINNDAAFATSVNNLGAYAGISYGTVRNAIIGSTNIGMHKNSKFNEMYFDILYAPTNLSTNLVNAEKPTNFSDLGLRFMFNISRLKYHQYTSLQTSLEIAKYPGTNSASIGLHIGIAFNPATKYNADSIANNLNTTYELTRKEGNTEIDSMLSGKKQPYDFVTKNKKGYYILREYDNLYARKPIKMVTTSREFIIKTTTTTRTVDSRGMTVKGYENSIHTTSRKKTEYYYYANFDATQKVVEFEDFSSPKKYKKSLLYSFLKESPTANEYYIKTIKDNRTIRRAVNYTSLGLIAAGIITAVQGNNNELGQGLAGGGAAVWVLGWFINRQMDKGNFTKALNLYNKDVKKYNK
jgi:hypothetical protein